MCVSGVCVVCVCVCLYVVCVCVSVCVRNHEHSTNEKFQTVSVEDAYLIIMLPQLLLRPTL